MKMDKWTQSGHLVVKLWISINGTHGVVSGHPISTNLPQVDSWSTRPLDFGVSQNVTMTNRAPEEK